jgi:hypothetical protein
MKKLKKHIEFLQRYPEKYKLADLKPSVLELLLVEVSIWRMPQNVLYQAPWIYS